MKYAISLSLLIILVLLSISIVYAQQTNSNTVRTKVGNPPLAADCPIPGAAPSCGSRNQQRNNCGHCDAAYTAAYGCDYEALAYAMDVPGSYGQAVILPSVSGDQIKWVFMDQQIHTDGRTAIQRYMGTDEKTGQQYIIQFHHTAPGSGAGTKFSGEVGANICNEPCDVGTGPHVHIEFAFVNQDGSYRWVDAPQYFCGPQV